MITAVFRKVETHRELQTLLLSTGEEEIVESAPGDYYWGCGADGSGQKKLGKILMEVRRIRFHRPVEEKPPGTSQAEVKRVIQYRKGL